MELPDAQTVRIPVIIRAGQLHFQINGSLADVRDGSHGELVIDASAVRNDQLRVELLQETTLTILPKDSKIYFHVNPADTPEALRQHLKHLPHAPHGNGSYVAADLRAELRLRLRGTKTATLENCPCFIPALNETAASVNHAYTLISQAFEPKRRSHTANVFSKAVYADEHGWHNKLELLRQSLPEQSQQT